MIDCARTLENRAYYPRLIDLMADWHYNLLVLHFSDDHGCTVRLPGFGRLAHPHAFRPEEIRALIRQAERRGIEVVPEIETFGHTRFLTDRPEYAHLRLGAGRRAISFNAIDPLHPDTHRLVRRLIRATAAVFPGRYIHVGGDEVELKAYCARRGLDERQVWSDYMTRVFGWVHENQRTPLFWSCRPGPEAADHVRALPRDAVALYWDYDARGTDRGLRALRAVDLRGHITAPAIACYDDRFLPSARSLLNVDRMARYARTHRALGMLTTVWCPFRYIQGAMDYAIAYAGAAAKTGGAPARTAFHRRFAREHLGLGMTPALDRILSLYPRLMIEHPMAVRLFAGDPFPPESLARMRTLNRLWRRLAPAMAAIAPPKNAAIWDAMRLAVDAAGLCTEAALLMAATAADREGPLAARVAAYRRLRRTTFQRLKADWDRTRYADDPDKRRTRFSNEGNQYALHILRTLPLR